MRRLILIICVNIAVFCTLIIFIEFAGQILYYVTHGRFVYQNSPPDYLFDRSQPNAFQYNSMFEQHPLLAVRPRKNVKIKNYMNDKEISTTDINTRWTGAPKDDGKSIKVAVLGGSTTFGTGVTDADSWPALLQSKLGNKFSVINYGVPCFATAEAIVQMALTVPEIKPEYIVLYEGWNDIVLYHEANFSPDYYSQGIEVQDCVQIPRYKEKTLFEKLNEVSAIVRLASAIKLSLAKHSIAQQVVTGDCTKYDTPDPDVDKIYVRNLKTLKLLSEHLAPYTLFVPQILNYRFYREKADGITFHDCWSKIKNSAMPDLMDRFNMLMKSVCPGDDTKCTFVDAVLEVKWEPDDFVDDGHFSRKGGEKFADAISRVILSKAKDANLPNAYIKHNVTIK